MGNPRRPLFDLNEPPAEENEDEAVVIAPCMPQKSLPILDLQPSSLLPGLEGSLRIVNNRAFIHADSASRFQPFVRVKEQHGSEECQMKGEDDSFARLSSMPEASGKRCETDMVEEVVDHPEPQLVEKEERELDNMEGDVQAAGCSDCSLKSRALKICPDAVLLNRNERDNCPDAVTLDMNVGSCVQESSNEDRANSFNNTRSSSGGGASAINECVSSNEDRVNSIKDGTIADRDASVDALGDPSFTVKRRDIKGVEASHALRLANLNLAKRAKYDEEEQKLGKLGKTKPKTILVGMEDVRNNSSMKSSIRRQCFLSPATITRTVKDISRPAAVVEKINGGPDHVFTNSKPSETNFGGGSLGQSREHKSESYGDAIVGSQPCSGKINGNDFHQEMHSLLVPRKGQLKQSGSYNHLGDLTFSPHRRTESRQCTTNAILVNKRPPSSRKQSLNSHKTRMHLWKGFFKR